MEKPPPQSIEEESAPLPQELVDSIITQYKLLVIKVLSKGKILLGFNSNGTETESEKKTATD